MAFTIIKGVMGSGKSYCGAESILQCLREGGVVHTNMPLRYETLVLMGYSEQLVLLPPNAADICRLEPGEKLPNGTFGKPTIHSDYLRGGKEGQENLVVIDEASLDFDIDTQVADRGKNKAIFTLVAMCRHVGLDLLFLTQSDGNIDAKLRRMCEKQIMCIKTTRIPFVGWFLAKLPWLGDFCRIYTNRQDKKPCGVTWHRFSSEVGEIYDTHGMRGGVAISTAATRRKGADITERRGKTWAVVVLLAIGLLAAFSYGNGTAMMNKYFGDHEAAHSPASPAPIAPVRIAPAGGIVAAAKAVVAPPPKPHPKTTVAEWDAEDEYALAVVWRGRFIGGVQCTTQSGLVLQVGSSYHGEIITTYVAHGDYHYFKTETGRYVVARPITPAEREEIRQRSQQQQQQRSMFTLPPLVAAQPTAPLQ